MINTSVRPRPVAGNIGFALGAIALLLVLTVFWAGPFAPQQDVTVTIGEATADIAKAAARKFVGMSQPEATPTPWNIDRALKLVAALLAGMAIVLGLTSFIRRETWRPAAGAVALGIGAIAFQYVTWLVLALIGTLLLFAIIQSFGSILGD